MLKRRKGSLTVEAVLILPIFMATILFISYFVKAHYVQDIVQDALTEAVMDVSAVSYPYYLSGALEFRNDIQEGTDSRREKLKQDFESVAELIEHVQNTGEAVKNKDMGGTIDNASGTIESAKTAKDAIEGISPTEIFSFGKYYVTNKGINVAEDYFARKLILGSMGNTLSVDGKNIVDRMSALGIEGGLDGFDFTGSVFYGEDDVIDVQVQYKLSKVDPFGFIKGVTLKNRVVCRAWMGGVDIDGDGGIKRVTVPAKMVVGEEDPEKDVDRTFKTCYIIPNSKTSDCYHFDDCSNLRKPGDSGKMKTVAAVQVPFVKTAGKWGPEGGSITYQGKAYTFCGSCAGGLFRVDGEKAEEPPAKDGLLPPTLVNKIDPNSKLVDQPTPPEKESPSKPEDTTEKPGVGAGNVVSEADKLKLSKWKYKPSDELYLKYKKVYDNPKYFNQATGDSKHPGTNGDGNTDGFLNGKFKIEKMKVGTMIDRYGENPTGQYFSPQGESYESRALAPYMDDVPYKKYKVIKEFEVKSGTIAPWWDREGMGSQYYTDLKIKDKDGNFVEATVDNLERNDYIEEITN